MMRSERKRTRMWHGGFGGVKAGNVARVLWGVKAGNVARVLWGMKAGNVARVLWGVKAGDVARWCGWCEGRECGTVAW